MLSSLSPYELLTASRPKPSSTFSTSYDLYCTFKHESAEMQSNSLHDAAPVSSDNNITPPPEHSLQVKRTHYIADIHARHNAANRFQRQSP